ncbi:methylated-DNA--[protein]-cysteine S-methyltransferase [Pseudonocardia humida]|uniref:Methylated-DNA--[protein]-cysteine S-methyltransferase n=1 Tax=Pseudonocardia humida TaxID=2800819 RepID=A0ABT0ZTL6_9PSEU|nr:methylated-DNA--[protein]-cysteine S-methyltransferase [Pseudonocardia humida]MCO1654068.1 methylated-DNA--[protein]-cysteine S-methyltransferase [Pseudonocardia humida]
MSTTATAPFAGPLGVLTVSATPEGVARLRFPNRDRSPADARGTGPARAVLDQALAELDEYFAGRRTRFDVAVDLSRVSGERREVLDALTRIDHGETTTYGALARALGMTGDGARRVGGALAANPVLVIVPCHRVVGADGALTGYAGGLRAKELLLGLERPRQLALDV